jgi:hypothetical protein
MIVPIFQSKQPLEVRGVSRIESPGYGPSAPEYQETIQIHTRAPETFSHPWKVSSAGSSSVTVADGKIMGLRENPTPTTGPWYAVAVSFAESDVSISGAGWVYAVIDTEKNLVFEDETPIPGAEDHYLVVNARTPTSVAARFSSSPPDSVSGGSTNQIWIPIAEVDIEDGAAVVVEQYLTHNPILFFETPGIG